MHNNTSNSNPKPCVHGASLLGKLTPKIAAIFIHYNQYGIITQGFLKLVRSALKCGFATFFVSTSENLRGYEDLASEGIIILKRENIGYDFGSLLEARRVILLSNKHIHLRRIVVCNNSMLNVGSEGFGFDSVLDQLTSSSEDLVGITESFERKNYHIQTPHFSVSGKFFFSEAFTNFASRYIASLKNTIAQRENAIINGELEMSRVAIEHGFSTKAIFPISMLLGLNSLSSVIDLSEKFRNALTKEINPLNHPEWLNNLTSDFSREILPLKPGFEDYNPIQACWALLLLKKYFFIKREILEIRSQQDMRCLTPPFLLYSVLELIRPIKFEDSDLLELSANFVVRS